MLISNVIKLRYLFPSHDPTGELFEFAKDLDTPFEDLKLYTEADYEQLKSFTWVKNTLVLSHY